MEVKRSGGRTNNQLRAVTSELGLLNKPDGSAKYTAGKSAVVVAVYGPIEVKHRDEILDRATIKVHWSPSSGTGGPEEREKEMIVANVVQNAIIATLHPRTLIEIVVQMLAAAINATCLALVDAGIPLKYRPAHPTLDFALELLSWIASVTCAIAQNGVFVLDPDLAEESAARAVLLFAFNNQNDGVVASHSVGVLRKSEGEGEEFYLTCLAAARQSAFTLFSYYAEANKALYQHLL
ncbi:3' exoribonuclease family, domain 1 domain containing protein [Acanthamoeba castellanii str. Neff]|uniref:3' exoribonuclease family, domain 1 domain containing protein n=1 Tax=Acanthamoeba castellanii (strain ATCC 30010 / Neff) TaxID=1257118 RepID=L8GW22_ACACF|nr:3' exoribonuclease family, domain 1 domain containing protein [Acanthamoeba castellanii str. Neff]ELR17429.1 3' exoribonuclease family, domain 1 domain containing protein [Acanthamoeba castellanii str. Neff]